MGASEPINQGGTDKPVLTDNAAPVIPGAAPVASLSPDLSNLEKIVASMKTSAQGEPGAGVPPPVASATIPPTGEQVELSQTDSLPLSEEEQRRKFDEEFGGKKPLGGAALADMTPPAEPAVSFSDEPYKNSGETPKPADSGLPGAAVVPESGIGAVVIDSPVNPVQTDEVGGLKSDESKKDDISLDAAMNTAAEVLMEKPGDIAPPAVEAAPVLGKTPANALQEKMVEIVKLPAEEQDEEIRKAIDNFWETILKNKKPPTS